MSSKVDFFSLPKEYGETMGVKLASYVASQGLFFKLTIVYFIVIFGYLITRNIKTTFLWQKYFMYFIVFNLAISIFFGNTTLFLLLLFSYFFTIFLSSMVYIQEAYKMTTLDKVEGRFPAISINFEKTIKFKSISEALKYNWKIGLGMIIQRIDNFLSPYIKVYTILSILYWLTVIIILIALVYFYLYTEYFVK